jgi:hypothetical protein
VSVPLAVFEPVTEKTTVMPGVGLPNRSVTVAVTQCCVSTSFTAVGGARITLAGGPGSTVTVVVSLLVSWIGSPS